ncbi:MAG: DUF6272 family protein [Cyanobacteria bacterium]|nr:DUF6272 family protein [Cyanobacteriota bacterium]MDW8200798.1 DUF6272 family protein [Cyanobacteriota bacterium SKYGB_h_bin112]
MSQIFGSFEEDPPTSQEYLVLSFSPSSTPLKQRWRTNGLSADFLADYLATFFPSETSAANPKITRAEVKGAVSYIANELLENAMKFSDESADYSISIGLHLYSDRLLFVARNSLTPERAAKFQTFLKKLTTEDPQELMIRQIEADVDETSQSGGAGLGLLTMINDYDAKLGWKFETICKDPTVMTVTTMVQLTLQDKGAI